METWTNILEAWVEKAQEMFNKDLEELEKTINTITEIRNTQEGTNIRITEAEEERNELEDKMIELKQNTMKKKE